MSARFINKMSSSPTALAAPAIVIAFLFILLIAARESGPPRLDVEILDVGRLPGWAGDDLEDAHAALQMSCRMIFGAAAADDPQAPFNPREALGPASAPKTLSGTRAAWAPACRTLLAAAPSDLRGVLEREFFAARLLERIPRQTLFGLPWFAGTRDEGLLTGYFEPEYLGARSPGGEFAAPILARPEDLVTVDLGIFREELAGQRIAGRVVDGKLSPYEDRAAIEGAGAREAGPALAWLRPEDAFFLQIQGSGRIRFEDGSVIRVGFDGHNGHPYTAIGRLLVDRGELDLPSVSMQTILAWLRQNAGAKAAELMNENKSYVFFRRLGDVDPDLGPPGGAGAPLTPRRSIAIDPRYAPYGAPMWIDGAAPDADGAERKLQRLFVAQDEGGAIKGPLRGDIFWGFGEEAGEIAGRMRARAGFYLLLPKALRSEIAG